MIRTIQFRSLVATILFSFVLLPPAFAQDKDHSQHSQHQTAEPQDLQQQIRDMQSRIGELEAALKQKHAAESGSMQGMSGGGMMGMGNKMGGGMKGMKDKGGMKGMKDKGGMRMKNMGGMSDGGMSGMSGGMGGMSGGMMGMQGTGMSRGMMMMGKMKNMGSMNTSSSLPGFPGASHIYHVGADGFFLNHGEHISLTEDQQQSLNKIKEATSLSQADLDRGIESAEQDLWVLTSSDQPDTEKIKAKIEEITKLQSQQRFEFIQAVGKAAKILTDKQRYELTGAGSGDGAK